MGEVGEAGLAVSEAGLAVNDLAATGALSGTHHVRRGRNTEGWPIDCIGRLTATQSRLPWAISLLATSAAGSRRRGARLRGVA